MGKSESKDNNHHLYKSAHKFYSQYRPEIPDKVVDIIVNYFNLEPEDSVLDLGSGTGQVARALEGKCNELIGLDPDSKMIEWAKRTTEDLTLNTIWLDYGSEDLDELKGQHRFKLATICRAFHWMDQKQVLRDLDDLIDVNGGLAVLGDGSFWTGNEEWQKTVKSTIQQYLGEERRAGKKKFKKPKISWETLIARSAFKSVETRKVSVTRTWDIESIIGYLFSTSFAAPDLFGNQTENFKQDIKKELKSINPKESYEEKATWSIILASRN